jgi:hypothetical protein
VAGAAGCAPFGVERWIDGAWGQEVQKQSGSLQRSVGAGARVGSGWYRVEGVDSVSYLAASGAVVRNLYVSRSSLHARARQ